MPNKQRSGLGHESGRELRRVRNGLCEGAMVCERGCDIPNKRWSGPCDYRGCC